MTTLPYTEVAEAGDTWAVRLASSVPMSLAAVRAMLELASTEAPLTAYARSSDDEVTDVIVARDPSRTHGTPGIADCERAAQRIRFASGWTATPLRSGVMVAMGLREGYDQSASTWTGRQVAEALPDATVTETVLVSCRRTPDGVQWWEEPCALIAAPSIDVTTLDDLASRMRQERYTITDHTNGRTVVRAVTP